MILTQNRLIELFPDHDIFDVTRRMAAIETAIRSYTNNNFQNRDIRFVAEVVNGKIMGTNPYLKVDDTLMISKGPNKGLYTITAIDSDGIEVLEPLYFDTKDNLVTKVEYPADILMGCAAMLNWDLSDTAESVRGGVKSETLSRHSVTYGSTDDSSSMISGYPAQLISFLNPYRKTKHN